MGSYRTYYNPSKTAALFPEFAVEDLPSIELQLAVKDLPLSRALWWWWLWFLIVLPTPSLHIEMVTYCTSYTNNRTWQIACKYTGIKICYKIDKLNFEANKHKEVRGTVRGGTAPKSQDRLKWLLPDSSTGDLVVKIKLNPWCYSPEEPRPTEVVAARWQYSRPCG